MNQPNCPAVSQVSEPFIHAVECWDLERLYKDLTAAKQRYRASDRQKLTTTEKAHLRGFLCGNSPQEIAAELHRDCRGLRVDWSRGLYRYVETLTETPLKSWKDIPKLLNRYRLPCYEIPIAPPDGLEIEPEITTEKQSAKNPQIDWGEAVDVSSFYGRTEELATLQQWIVGDRVRVVAIAGMPGIGKTTLASKLLREVAGDFDRVIWRSLDGTPPLIDILSQLITFLSGDGTTSSKWHENHDSAKAAIALRSRSLPHTIPENSPPDSNPDSSNQGLRELIDCLQQQRCLLIFDRWANLFAEHAFAGTYRSECRGYGELLHQAATLPHQSCIILTSAVVPKAIATLSGVRRPVRSLKLPGLHEDAEYLLREKSLWETDRYSDLIAAYGGNPLVLQIVATTIGEMFGGQISEFLKHDWFVGDYDDRIARHFRQLTDAEWEILDYLKNKPQPVTLIELASTCETDQELQALESLQRRSLVKLIRKNYQVRYTVPNLVRHCAIAHN